MRTAYPELDIHFTVDGITVHTLNIIFERFMRTIPAHSHGNGCYEIHYIPYGQGKLCADDTYYDIVPNTLYVTGPHVEHAQTPLLQDPMQEYCIYLKIGKNAQNKASALMDTFVRTPFWIGQDSQDIHALFRQLFWELEHQYTGYQEQIRTLLIQIVIRIIRNYEQRRETGAKNAAQRQVDNKSMIIEEYFLYEYKSLSLNELAARLYLSPRQTQRLLQEYYGKTFQEKKAEARMSAAAILLSDKSKSIASIADALGYSSPEQFATAFKGYYQKSPTSFRKTLG